MTKDTIVYNDITGYFVRPEGFTKYKFSPILGPAKDHPVGSREWPECVGNELDCRAGWAKRDAVDAMLELIRRVMSADVPPWAVWPDPPCGSADAYFRLCIGLSYQQLWTLMDTF